ncbi:SusC/RagA family TonB-linked outer membrane protein [Pedobacter sp. GR22-6]|uniref:SusC/RagA family TonB-linked outer membrane protein n=1 Tax=Pedobacter sp. GR22-6 TaxID=3127957 RepID=UPI00307E67E0
MKLIIVLMTTFLIQANAAGSYAQKVTLNEKGATLGNVIDKIRALTGYDFVFNSKDVENAKKVTINLKNVELEEALKVLFSNQNFRYSITDRFIVVERVQPSIMDQLRAAFVNIDVRGRVVDSLGSPLPGATVVVKGQKQGVRTGSDGSFFLQNVEENAVLVITYTGFVTKELSAAKDLGVIRMQMDVGKLNEVEVVVNTGYQRIKPEQSTGAVSQIGTKEYEARISTNFLDGLVNRLPGLMINNNVQFTSTLPGSTTTTSRSLFNIRGISTMSANQTPLIVVDGYPTDLTLDMIDPNEIKSVTILKDAAAATVYGVRASNGVIVIERKQAKAGLAQFTFRTTLGVTPKENYSHYRWAKDASAINVGYWAATQAANVNNQSYGLLFSGAQGRINRSPVYYVLAQAAGNMITADQAANTLAEMSSYDNLEDYSDLFLRNAVTRTHNFNVSGGNDNALYYITANYTGNLQSQLKNDDNRFSLSGRTTLKLSKKLSLELTTDYQEQRSNSAPVPGVNSAAPFERYQDVNGNPAPMIGSSIAVPFNNFIMSQGFQDNMYYPLIDFNEITDKTRTINNRITANFRYGLGAGFDLSFGGIYETSRSNSDHLANQESSEVKQAINAYTIKNADGTMKYSIPFGSFLRQQNGSTSSYTARAQLNYNKVIGDHSFNAILGAEMRSLKSQSNLTSAFGYNDETLALQGVDFGLINLGSTTVRGTQITSPSYTGLINNFFNQQSAEDRFLSGYSNIVYSYQNKYSITGSIRIDQSNLFGTNPKYKYKPLWSLGAAWNIHREDFMEDIAWINLLKLRAAYGFNGNVAKLSLPQVIAKSTVNPYIPANNQPLGLQSYANSSLRWEQTRNFNVGLDFDIFKNVTGTVDYYQKNSTDLLGNVLIDPTLGISPTLINQANIRNKGLEFSLHADWISTNNFNWNTGIVVSRNTSKVLEVYRKGDYTPTALLNLGYVKDFPVGAMFGYDYAGLDNAGYPLVRDPQGNLLATNINSAGNATAAALASETSGLTHYLGSSIPTINGGLSNRVDVGSFYVFAMINYYGGFKVRVPRPSPSASRALEGSGNYWKAPGDEMNTDVQSLAAFLSSANSNNVYNWSEQSVVHGDYITLGDLTLSYNLDKVNFIKSAGFKNFEIKAQASNLYSLGLNRHNFSMATGSYVKSYVTPTYTIGIFTNF